MKLVPRLVAVTAGTVFLASALAGGVLVRLERAQLVSEETSESRVLVRSLQVSVENALRDGQDPDISELLGRLELVARQVDVLVYLLDAPDPVQASEGSDPSDSEVRAMRAELASGQDVVRVVEGGPDGSRLVVGAPLRTDAGERIGTLVVSRPLAELDADLRATTGVIVGSVFAFAVVTTMVMLVLLRREVIQPLSRIARATERLGESLDAPLGLRAAPSEELEAVQQTLVQLQAQLRRIRDARAAEVLQRERLERQLRDADKLIVVGQLAAGVAHEIGSPLQVLIGRARLLGSDEERDDEVRRQAGLIVLHAERIAAIVERLQDVVRRRPTRLRAVSLEAPIEQVIWLVGPEAKRRGVRLDWVGPLEAVRVRADPDEVQQVGLNLILNALQATPRGGSVSVGVRQGPDGGRLEVRDTGPGIPDEVRHRVFQPFFTTRVDEGGTGLGLAVVKSIADRHRAQLWLTSEEGVGTTVTMCWTLEES